MFIYSKTKVQKNPKTGLIIDHYKVIYNYFYYININHICVRIILILERPFVGFEGLIRDPFFI